MSLFRRCSSWRTGLLLLLVSLSPYKLAIAQVPIDVTDCRGVRLKLAKPPSRIVSLTPANTEIVFALGAGKRLVGVTEYCDYPAEAKAIRKVGDVSISVEKVAALRPDLVIASASASRKAIQEIERLRLAPVFAIDPNTFEETWRDIAAVGRAIGAEAEARNLLESLTKRVQAVRALPPPHRRISVLAVVQTTPLWTAGAGTFIDDLVQTAGGENLARRDGKGYFSIPSERAILLKPDVILTSAESVPKIPNIPGWSAMPAVRAKRIFALGPEASRPGPRLVGVLERLHKLLSQAYP